MLRSQAPLPLLLLALAALPGASPPADTGLDLLRKSAAVYRRADVFQLEGEIHAEMRSGEQRQETNASFRVAVGGQGRVHDELAHQQAGMTRISDGKQTWMYMSSLNQYTHKNEVDAADMGQAGSGSGMLGVLLAALRQMDDSLESVKALPDESIRYGGAERKCAVVEVIYKPGAGVPAMAGMPRTFWIDRERHWVLQTRAVLSKPASAGSQAIQQAETFRYTLVRLGQPPDASLFTFQPPAGAKLVEEFGSGPRRESLAGQMAGEFSLADLSGKQHSLKAQRGKVVMLDFWASWCGPCRIQMPMVEKLHEEYRGKGLVVYAVNQGESAETARKYLEKNKYSTPTLLDRKNDVGRQYKVTGIPTLVIIDREGKIAAHYVGVRSEAALREGLKKAGL